MVERSAMIQIEFNAVPQKPLELITHRTDTVIPKQHQTLKQPGFKAASQVIRGSLTRYGWVSRRLVMLGWRRSKFSRIC